MDFEKWISQIEARGIFPDRPLRLDWMKASIEESRIEIDSKKVILVGGTNGKGSTCATLEALLLSSGKQVGLTTSPHLIQTTERFRVNGKDLSEARFCELADTLTKLLPKTGPNLSHFEFLMMMAVLLFFKEEDLDFVIIEVGLGGRWDASNAIPHGTAVFATLAMDHQEFLGNSLLEIAHNKFDIIRPETTRVIHLPYPPEIEAALQEHISHQAVLCSKIYPSETHPFETILLHPVHGRIPLSLSGQGAVINTSLALTVFESLGFEFQDPSALKSVRWPGRMERVDLDGKTLILSGDHNVEGIELLIKNLELFSEFELVLGIGVRKDADSMLHKIKSSKIPFSLCGGFFQARKKDDYFFLNEDLVFIENPKELLKKITTSHQKLWVISGSLYFVGELKKVLMKNLINGA